MPHLIFLHKFLERGQEVSHCETFKLGNCSQGQLPNFFAEEPHYSSFLYSRIPKMVRGQKTQFDWFLSEFNVALILF